MIASSAGELGESALLLCCALLSSQCTQFGKNSFGKTSLGLFDIFLTIHSKNRFLQKAYSLSIEESVGIKAYVCLKVELSKLNHFLLHAKT